MILLIVILFVTVKIKYRERIRDYYCVENKPGISTVPLSSLKSHCPGTPKFDLCLMLLIEVVCEPGAA